MADSRDWEKTGSATESGTEKTKTTIITERSRVGEEEERRHGAGDSSGVKSYTAEYASGLSGSDEPVRGATGEAGQGGGSGAYPQPRQGEVPYREQAGRMAREARERGKGFLEEQKSTAADSLQRVASILHETAERVEDDQPSLSQIFHRGASGVDRFAATLRERNTESMVNEIQDFARRQPAIMLGGMVAAGFFLSRLLKSSSSHSESDYASSRLSGMREKVEERFGRGEEERTAAAGEIETGEGLSTYREYREGQDLSGLPKTEEERHATD